MRVTRKSQFGRNEVVSAIIASVVAATLAGGLMQVVGGAGAMRQFAHLVGTTTLVAGWGVWLAQGILLGVAFAVGVARAVDPFTDLVIRISQASRLVRALLVPILRRSALPVVAGCLGFLYGQFLLVPAFAYLAPVALAVQGYAVAVPLATVPLVLGFVVYGTVLGATYGLLLATPWFDLHRIGDAHAAALVGAVAGGVVGTGVLAAVGGTDLLVALGAASGSASVTRGALLAMAIAVAFGLLFAGVLARTINDFTNTVIMFSRRSELTQRILVPLLSRAALTVTAGAMGLLYGLVLGVGVVGLGVAGVVPETGLAGLLACTAYGYVLGNGYGLVLEDVALPELGPSAEQRAGLLGAVGAGLVSAGVLALVVGLSVFGSFADQLGLTGPATTALNDALRTVASVVPPSVPVVGDAGWLVALVGPVLGGAVWLGGAVALGLVFVAVVARTINDFTNTVIMFSRRSELTQKILVPLISRAALTVTAGAMGLVYGLVLGGVVAGLGVVGVLPRTGLAGLLAGTVYGYVLGNGYGLLMEDVDLSGLGPGEQQRAGLVGSVGAGLVSAGVFALVVGPSAFAALAAPVGVAVPLVPGPLVGVALWLGGAVALGLVFVVYVSRTVNDFTNTVIMFSQRSEFTQKVLVPLLSRAALTVTAGAMGLLYGLVLGVVAYGGVLASGVVLAGAAPQVSPLVVVAFAVYGHALGTSYGLLLEDVDLAVDIPFLSGRDDDQDSVSLVEVDTDWRPPVPVLSDRGGDDTESVSLVEYDPDWQPRRPATGALLLLAAGAVVGGLPLQRGLAATPSPAALGVVVGSMLVACGLFALVKPQLSTLVGVTAVGLATVSIVAGFGGLFVGMVLALVGGVRCLAWEDPTSHDGSTSHGLVRVDDAD